MNDNCAILAIPCEDSLFTVTGRCTDITTTTTSTTSTSTTTTSSTTTTTTTLTPQTFTINNDSLYPDLQYFVYEINPTGTPLLLSGFVQPTETKIHTFNTSATATSVTIYVKQYQGNTIYVTATLEVTSQPDDIDDYPFGVTEFQFNNVIDSALNYELTIEDTDPIITTTSTSTTSTTSTSTSTTSTSTSTSTTSTSTTTTTSSTTTTTTTIEENILIRVKNVGTPTIGFNTQAWNVNGLTQIQYYALTGGVLTSGNTQTPYNNNIEAGNQTRVLYENTTTNELTISFYWSINNGTSYTLLGSVFIPPYSGVGPYTFDDSIWNTVPNGIGITNILEMRVLAF